MALVTTLRGSILHHKQRVAEIAQLQGGVNAIASDLSSAQLTAISFSPDGRLLASCSSADGVCVTDTTSLKSVEDRSIFEDQISSVSFAPFRILSSSKLPKSKSDDAKQSSNETKPSKKGSNPRYLIGTSSGATATVYRCKLNSSKSITGTTDRETDNGLVCTHAGEVRAALNFKMEFVCQCRILSGRSFPDKRARFLHLCGSRVVMNLLDWKVGKSRQNETQETNTEQDNAINIVPITSYHVQPETTGDETEMRLSRVAEYECAGSTLTELSTNETGSLILATSVDVTVAMTWDESKKDLVFLEEFLEGFRHISVPWKDCGFAFAAVRAAQPQRVNLMAFETEKRRFVQLYHFICSSPITSTCLSRDGRVLACGLQSGTVQLFNTTTGAVIATVSTQASTTESAATTTTTTIAAAADTPSTTADSKSTDAGAALPSAACVALSKDSKLLAVGLSDLSVHLFNLEWSQSNVSKE